MIGKVSDSLKLLSYKNDLSFQNMFIMYVMSCYVNKTRFSKKPRFKVFLKK